MADVNPPVSPSENTTALSEAQKAEMDAFFTSLEKQAAKVQWDFMHARVPPLMQEEFKTRYPEPVDEPPAQEPPAGTA